jgi:hypothetical protein
VSETHEFATAAQRYCAFVDDTEALERDDLVVQLQGHLVCLYGSALRLPAGEPSESDVAEAKHDDWAALHERLRLQLGDFDHYSFVFDPYDLVRPPWSAALLTTSLRSIRI